MTRRPQPQRQVQVVSAAMMALLALFAAGCQPSAPQKTAAAAASSASPSAPATGLAGFQTGDLKELDFSQKLDLPASPFFDAAGKPHTFAEFKGKVVVLNIWAEWCAPCVEEMPTLAKLQKAFPSGEVVVVPVAFDYANKRDSSRDKLAKLVGQDLPFYFDSTYNVSYDAKTGAFPSTIIFGKDGKEAARLMRPADWSSERATGLVKAILDGRS